MDIHLIIKDVRQRTNFSQADMAEKMNLSLVSYSNIERGITELSVKRLYEIAKILEVPINELLGFEVQPNDESKVSELQTQIQEKNKLLAFYENAKVSVNTNYVWQMISEIWEKGFATKGEIFEEYKYIVHYKTDTDKYIEYFLINTIQSNDLGISLSNSGLVTIDSLKEFFEKYRNMIPQKFKSV